MVKEQQKISQSDAFHKIWQSQWKMVWRCQQLVSQSVPLLLDNCISCQLKGEIISLSTGSLCVETNGSYGLL